MTVMMAGRRSGKMTRKKSRPGRRAVDDGGLVELPRDGRHEGPEDEHREGQDERDLDEDEPEQRLEEAQPLQHVDRRARAPAGGSGPASSRAADERRPRGRAGAAARSRPSPPARTMRRHRGDGQDDAVPERRDDAGRRRASRTSWTFSSRCHSVGRLNSRREASAWSLAAVSEHEDEGHDEDDAAATSSATTPEPARRGCRRRALTARSPCARRTASSGRR